MTATEQDYVQVIKDQSDTIERFARTIDDLHDVINLKEQSIQILEETISIMKSRVDTKDAIIKVKEDMIQMLDEHINNIWKAKESLPDPLAQKVDELETELVKVNAENDKWMMLCDKYLKKISDLEEWLTHYDGEIEYYQRKVEELSELNHSYRETIKDLNDRLTDKYHHTVSDMRQVNESLDRDPQKIGALQEILEQLRNERLGNNPVV
jgi:chromosome segregation ATPase